MTTYPATTPPEAPSGAPADVAPQSQGASPINPETGNRGAMPTAAPPPPGYSGPAPSQAPPPPLNADESFLYGAGPDTPQSPLARPGAKIPPPPEARQLMGLLSQAANGPAASPELKQLLALLAHHASS